jgi:ribosomal protein L7/L12
MNLYEFVENLNDRSFRVLMDACVARLQNDKPHASMLEVERHLAEYNRIQAIKAVRARLNLGLKEAKDLVDREVPRKSDPGGAY